MTNGMVVGILRGGPQEGHEHSVRSGQLALTSLPSDRYVLRDIYIDRNGVWYDRGRQSTPGKILPTIDIALVLLTGPYGSSGEVQRLLSQFGVPYTGSDPMPAFTAAHGVLAREHAKELGLRVPRYRHADAHDQVHAEVAEAARTFLPPLIVRPSAAHGHASAQVLTGYEPVKQAVTGMLASNRGGVLIEEHVRGPRVRVGVLDKLRGQDRYVLPARTEADPHARSSAPPLSKQQRNEIEDLARKLHDALGLRHHSESMFVLSPRGVIYLGTDPFPHMSPDMPFGEMLKGVGISPDELFSHLLDLASKEGRR